MKQIKIFLCALAWMGYVQLSRADETSERALTVVVMDPLSAKLSCDCVAGFAQRDYEKLGNFLSKQLSRKVNVVWAESLKAALEESKGQADLIIGKCSVVLHDAKDQKIELKPIAQLTDQKDRVEQTGLFVVRTNDPAKSVDDLKGYRILFGPGYCDEKSAAMVDLLKSHSVPVPEPMEVSASCSTAALALMELPADEKAAAVISSYAVPLLEGCKKVKKGDLRVIGESKPVPFITAFVPKDMPAKAVDQINHALDQVGLDAQLLIDMETASGFVPWQGAESEKKATTVRNSKS